MSFRIFIENILNKKLFFTLRCLLFFQFFDNQVIEKITFKLYNKKFCGNNNFLYLIEERLQNFVKHFSYKFKNLSQFNLKISPIRLSKKYPPELFSLSGIKAIKQFNLNYLIYFIIFYLISKLV